MNELTDLLALGVLPAAVGFFSGFAQDTIMDSRIERAKFFADNEAEWIKIHDKSRKSLNFLKKNHLNTSLMFGVAAGLLTYLKARNPYLTLGCAAEGSAALYYSRDLGIKVSRKLRNSQRLSARQEKHLDSLIIDIPAKIDAGMSGVDASEDVIYYADKILKSKTNLQILEKLNERVLYVAKLLEFYSNLKHLYGHDDPGIISIVPDKPTLDNKALAFITHQGSLYQMRLSTEELPNPDVCDNSDLIKITASPDKIEWDGTTSALARHQYNNRDGNNLFFRASDDLPIPFQMPYVLQIYIKNILGRDKDG